MEVYDKKNGQQLILSEEVYNGINKILDDLVANTRADMVVFCETNGYPVTHKGNIPGIDLMVISSLAANNISATAEMASMIGESGSFKFLFHEGQNRNIFLSNVGYNFILVVIFNVEVALGMVRIYTKRTIESLIKLLDSAKKEDEESVEFLDLEFKSLLSKELNRSFKI
jgi:predicted regulator of Ras-like GTPase activity (Roadblock/LC7/MglB family)